MDSREQIAASAAHAAGPDLAAIERVYDVIAAEGAVAGIEHLLSFSHDDVEMRPYAAQAIASPSGERVEVLRGREEIASFFRDRSESGFGFRLNARRFELLDDTVAVRGSIRVERPDGSFAETNVSWCFRFRDGLVESIEWQPRAGR